MKLAYWPGCVSRGFTPELHGSVAKVAPLLDLELVELDRANCCGAGVIAEHNQELVDTLNARTFALAQEVEGAAGMMNICSTCQGAQSECQERLDASGAYRDTVNRHLTRLRVAHTSPDAPAVDVQAKLAGRWIRVWQRSVAMRDEKVVGDRPPRQGAEERLICRTHQVAVVQVAIAHHRQRGVAPHPGDALGGL